MRQTLLEHNESDHPHVLLSQSRHRQIMRLHTILILCGIVLLEIGVAHGFSVTRSSTGTVHHRQWAEDVTSTVSSSRMSLMRSMLPSTSRSSGWGIVGGSSSRGNNSNKNGCCCWASKKKKQAGDAGDFDWYDKVDDDASPDDVFRAEMERQRLMNEVAGLESSSLSASASASMYNDSSQSSSPNDYSPPTTASVFVAPSSFSGLPPPPPPTPPTQQQQQQQQQQMSSRGSTISSRQEEERSTEATLAEYAAHMVHDNWLNEALANPWDFEQEEMDLEEQRSLLDAQLDEWDNDDGNDNDGPSSWENNIAGQEPWDTYGDPEPPNGNDEDEYAVPLHLDKNGKAAQFLYDEQDEMKHPGEAEREEKEYLERLSEIRIRSKRLEGARNNPKAEAYFAREPRAHEGYDRMWVSAIDNVCVQNLAVFRDYGVEFADNFGDWTNQIPTDAFATIEDIASYKARQVYNITGLPCIASRTSFDIEPIPKEMAASLNNVNSNIGRQQQQSGRVVQQQTNTRVQSGYRFNDIADHVDYTVEALKPVSEPTRVTRFRSCLCFYDGEMEVFDYGVCDVDLYFCNSRRTFIPMSSAIHEMCKTLKLTFGLEYQKWLKTKVREAMGGHGDATLKLRDRVLKEGKVLPNDIIDVSAFMDSMVDVNLMDECGKELAERFFDMKPTKILTVATTGLVIAIPMAKYLQVPVVYARKERSIVMADTYQASYSSKTVGKNRELLVSTQHLHKDDRILIVDDFLSSGAIQEALLRIVLDAGAVPMGVAVLLEKVYDAGRQSLSGFNIPVESVVGVSSVRDGIISLVEEDGFHMPQ